MRNTAPMNIYLELAFRFRPKELVRVLAHTICFFTAVVVVCNVRAQSQEKDLRAIRVNAKVSEILSTAERKVDAVWSSEFGVKSNNRINVSAYYAVPAKKGGIYLFGDFVAGSVITKISGEGTHIWSVVFPAPTNPTDPVVLMQTLLENESGGVTAVGNFGRRDIVHTGPYQLIRAEISDLGELISMSDTLRPFIRSQLQSRIYQSGNSSIYYTASRMDTIRLIHLDLTDEKELEHKDFPTYLLTAYAPEFFQLSDGSNVLTGRSSGSGGQFEHYAIRLDSAYNEISRFVIPYPENYSCKIAPFNGGYFTTYIEQPSGEHKMRIVRYTTGGTKIWSYEPFPNYLIDPYKVVPASDGGFLIVGTRGYRDSSGVPNRDESLSDCFIAKISYSGSVLWSHTYGYEGKTDVYRNVIETKIGEYLAIGGAGYSDSTDSVMLATLYKESEASTVVSEATADELLYLKPNPATVEIQIVSQASLSNIEIMNSLGVTMFSIPSSAASAKTIDVSSLSNGLYFLRGMHGTEVTVKAFVVSR